MHSTRSLLVVLVWLGVLTSGCMEPGRDAPLRSPSNDFRPPPPTTSDGRVVGVDNKAPTDHIAEGATSQGMAPGWEVRRGVPVYDAKRRVGGSLDLSGHHGHDEDAAHRARPPWKSTPPGRPPWSLSPR